MGTFSNKKFTPDDREILKKYDSPGIVVFDHDKHAVVCGGDEQDTYRVQIFSIVNNSYIVHADRSSDIFLTSELIDALDAAAEIYIYAER